MKTKLTCTLLVAALSACGDDTVDPVADMGTDMGAPDMGPSTPPPPPTLGAQIDRHGRSGVTTALISVLEDDLPRNMARDAYNAAGPASWGDFTPNIAANLAVYDSLDGTCGNQLLAGPNPEAGRYDGFAGALADDRLYIRSTASTCQQYFAVELDATQVAPNADCGGRTPGYDTIDVTYSALAIGAVSGVTDGVGADDGTHSAGTFPFLGEP
ncbi:MAG: hypothetical protein AAFZ18_13395 [Myxococcota bacterium]